MIMSKLEKFVRADIAAGNSVLLVSDSGRGKSDFTHALYETLAAEDKAKGRSCGFQALFLATQTPPDLIGYQFKGEGEYDGVKFARSEASIPLWMQSTEGKPAWAYDRFFLFLDEYGQGEPDVKRASAELLLNGKIGPWKLPPFSVRIAATNRGARYGVTKDFDFVINRRAEYQITDDLNSWLAWADAPYRHEGEEWMVMPVTKAFAAENPAVLFEEAPKQQGPWCTPRSLCAADRFLQFVEQAEGEINAQDPLIAEAVASKIGVPAAGAYVGWLQYRYDLPQYNEVVADPVECPKPLKPDMQMLMAYELAARTEREDLAKVITYMNRFPKDLAITYVQALLKRDRSVILEPAMAAWTAKNATLLSLAQSHG